jgi:hypothetical protein
MDVLDCFESKAKGGWDAVLTCLPKERSLMITFLNFCRWFAFAIIVCYVTIAFYLKRPFDDTHQDQI